MFFCENTLIHELIQWVKNKISPCFSLSKKKIHDESNIKNTFEEHIEYF